MAFMKKAVGRLLEWSEFFRRKDARLGYHRPEGRFLHLMVDMVERCNLRCTHCAFVWWRDEVLDGATLSDELLAKLEREVLPRCVRVSLSCFHEPLVAPNRLLRAIEACRRAGVPRIDFVTNALLFTEKTAREVMRAGVHRIHVSVDGASPETYDRIRVGGSFEDFVEKIALMSRVRDELGFDHKAVELTFISCMMRSNVHEAPALVDLAARHKFHAVELRYMMKTDRAPIDASELLCHVPEEADRAFDRAVERAKAQDITLELLPVRFREAAARAHLVTGPPPFIDCKSAVSTMVLSPKGEVYPCCLWHGSDALLRVERQSFDEVWNGKAMRTLRRELETGALTREGCRQCLVHYDRTDPRYWKAYHFRV